MPRNKELADHLERKQLILKGRFRLPSGDLTDAAIDIRGLLEDPKLAEPLIAALSDLLADSNLDWIVGASLGGSIVAWQIASRLKTKLYYLGYEPTTHLIDPGAELNGARIAIVDGAFLSPAQFDQVVRLIRSRSGDVVALGAMVALPMRMADVPIPAFAAVELEAHIFPPNAVPADIIRLPEQDFPVW